MSRKYKFCDLEGLYFVSFATVYWIDVFTREDYCSVFSQSLDYCRKNKGMELFVWCIMPSHVHLIFRAKENNPGELMRDLKKHTSKALVNCITEHPQESRKEWILWMMKRAGQRNSNVTGHQFWQQDNHPIQLWSGEIIAQKADYIHNNPVTAGLVTEPQHWKYSSAIDYSGGKGVLNIDLL